MMSFTNPNTETQTALEIDLTKPIVDIVATEEVKASETPKWDGRGIRLNTREEFIEYVADRVCNERAVLYQRALVYVDKLNRPEKAIADLRRYLELNPDNPNG